MSTATEFVSSCVVTEHKVQSVPGQGPGTDSLYVSCSVQEQYVFIHQCVLLMWQKKKQHTITSDVIYENSSKT